MCVCVWGGGGGGGGGEVRRASFFSENIEGGWQGRGVGGLLFSLKTLLLV